VLVEAALWPEVAILDEAPMAEESGRHRLLHSFVLEKGTRLREVRDGKHGRLFR
jgi:hypothetical protein